MSILRPESAVSLLRPSCGVHLAISVLQPEAVLLVVVTLAGISAHSTGSQHAHSTGSQQVHCSWNWVSIFIVYLRLSNTQHRVTACSLGQRQELPAVIRADLELSDWRWATR